MSLSPSAKIAAGICALVLVGLLGHAIARVAERGRFAAAFSTYGAGAEGTRALFRLTQELGLPAERLTREPVGLGPGTLVVVGSCQEAFARPPQRPELEAVTDWVQRGGLLIVADHDAFMPKAAGISIDPLNPCSSSAEDPFSRWLETQMERGYDTAAAGSIEVSPVGAPLTHMAPFQVERVTTLHTSLESQATEILTSELGPVGLTAPVGRGRVVLLGLADALTNGQVATGAGIAFARLLRAFAPKGPVWFDEYHLGMGERRSLIRYLRDTGYGPALLEAVLLVFALLFAGAGHIARPKPPSEARASPPRFAWTLGRLYERTGDSRGAARVLSDHMLARIARRYHASPTARSELVSWLRRQGLFAVAQYAALVEEHGRAPLSPGETLAHRAQAIERDGAAAIALGDAR